MDLIDYGFDPSFYIPPDMDRGEDQRIPARVTACHKERYELACERGAAFGRLKAGVYHAGSPEHYPTTGDFVLIEYNDSGDSRIVKTLRRRSFFSRRDPSKRPSEQAVAANFDYVFIMQSLNMDFNLRRIERYVTLAWQSGAVPVIILSKSDLARDIEGYISAVEGVAPGVAVFPVSVVSGAGLEAVEGLLKPRTTVVFLGSSGVGKSSLVNALAGRGIMTVNGIREDDSKGRHTTTHRQLVMLQDGAMVIDTPGMRELGMWDVSRGLGGSFGDVERYFSRCRFSDCSHIAEPGCAVRAAIESGELPRERRESYVNLRREAQYAEDKDAYIHRKEQMFRGIAKANRQMEKNGGKQRWI